MSEKREKMLTRYIVLLRKMMSHKENSPEYKHLAQSAAVLKRYLTKWHPDEVG